jgi:hypothetical protein
MAALAVRRAQRRLDLARLGSTGRIGLAVAQRGEPLAQTPVLGERRLDIGPRRLRAGKRCSRG